MDDAPDASELVQIARKQLILYALATFMPCDKYSPQITENNTLKCRS
jgi:hypothetical protein